MKTPAFFLDLCVEAKLRQNVNNQKPNQFTKLLFYSYPILYLQECLKITVLEPCSVHGVYSVPGVYTVYTGPGV